jgi:hypothetical protein
MGEPLGIDPVCLLPRPTSGSTQYGTSKLVPEKSIPFRV